MASRFTFGGYGGDQVTQDPAGNSGFFKAAANYASVGTFWSAQTGGTQYTDLVDPNNGFIHITGISTDAHGDIVPFQGPAGIGEGWVDFGRGRFKVIANEGIGAVAFPSSPAAFNLLMRDSTNAVMVWTTSQASVARALGWTIVTDPAYGAVADDTTDNLAKFNAAVTATPTGGTVYVPPAASRYYLSGQLDLSAKPVQLVGGGWNCTVQPAYGSAGFTVAGIVGSVLRFGNTTGAGVYVGDGTNSGSVRDLAIIGPGSGSSRGLQVGNTAAKLRYRVERVLVGNWFQGFWTCMENSTILGLYALGNDSGVTLTNASNGNTFVGLNVELSTTYGLRLDASTTNQFSGGVFQGGSGTTISLVNSSQGNVWDGVYLENLGATWGVDEAAGCDSNQWRGCHFGYGATHDQMRLAGNHNAVLWPQSAPQVTVSGANNFFIGSFPNGTNSDTGTGNVWIDTTGGMGVKFGGRDVRINSGQKFYFETSGTNSYITRDNATGDTVLGSATGTTRVSSGGYALITATKTGSYTLTTANDAVIFNGATLTATLPDPTTIGVGRLFRVKNINASALTVVSAGTSKTIDGAASQSLAQWASARYVSDGTQWLTV